MPSSDVYYEIVPCTEGLPVGKPASAVWWATAIKAYKRFKELDKPLDNHLEGEYYFSEERVHTYANLCLGVIEDDEKGALDGRWVGKCIADRPQAQYNYLRETSGGRLRLTVPGECNGVRECPEDFNPNKVLLKDWYENEVTYLW